MPRFFSTCASGSTHCRENTPTICRFTPAGLDSGPSRLKMVRVPSSTRVGADILHRRMMRGREHEADAGLADAARHLFGRQLDLDAERHQHVGRAGARGERAVAMLGDRHAGARDDQAPRRWRCCRCRSIAAGADHIDGVRGRFHPQHLRAHRGHRAGDLVDGLAAHAQRHQQPAHLRWRRLARHHQVEALAASSRLKRRAGRHLADERLEIVGHVRPLNVPACASRSCRVLASHSSRRRARENSAKSDDRVSEAMLSG